VSDFESAVDDLAGVESWPVADGGEANCAAEAAAASSAALRFGAAAGFVSDTSGIGAIVIVSGSGGNAGGCREFGVSGGSGTALFVIAISGATDGTIEMAGFSAIEPIAVSGV
jgi:hypothetical protein